MNFSPRRFAPLAACLGLCLLALAGCSGVDYPVRIKPIKAGANTILRPKFRAAYYRTDRGGNVDFYFAKTSRDATLGGKVRQMFLVRVFWRPIPGQTPISRTAINATFRFVVTTPNGAGMYEGAGFVWLHNGLRARTMHATILAGELRLTQATAYFHDPLGRARISGVIKAKRSAARTLALSLHAQRLFFRTTYAHRAAAQ